jgi:hypothetical protein
MLLSLVGLIPQSYLVHTCFLQLLRRWVIVLFLVARPSLLNHRQAARLFSSIQGLFPVPHCQLFLLVYLYLFFTILSTNNEAQIALQPEINQRPYASPSF